MSNSTHHPLLAMLSKYVAQTFKLLTDGGDFVASGGFEIFSELDVSMIL